MSVATYTKTGTKATKAATLDDAIFGVEVSNHELLKQAYIAYQSNGRPNLAKTLRRGEVSGGGKKPWKQKGTGRARFGSIRVPIWRGGGITFGPLGVENYSKKLSLTAKRTALRQALSIKTAAGCVIVVEDMVPADGKTAQAVAFLKKIGAQGTTLVVTDTKTDAQARALRNVADVTLVQANYLNVYVIMNADSIVITEKALAKVHEWLTKTKETK